jgi:hypothetical protein
MITANSNTAEVFEMTIKQIFGNALYELGSAEGRLRPFVFGGAGAAFFAATDLDGETRAAWNIGGGLKWLLHQRVGIEGRFGYKPSMLSDADAPPCGPFGFCQNVLNQIDIGTSAIFRF